jgi:alpha-mannosidase
MVYEDAEKLYAEVARDGKALFKEAASAYLQNIIPISKVLEASSPYPKGRLVAMNTVHHKRREVVEIPMVGSAAVHLKSEVIQLSKDGSKAYALMENDTDAADILYTKGMYADVKPVQGL